MLLPVIVFTVFASQISSRPLSSTYSFPCPLTYPSENPSISGCDPGLSSCQPSSYQKISCYPYPGITNPCYPIHLCVECEPNTDPNPQNPSPKPVSRQEQCKRLLSSLCGLPSSLAGKLLNGEFSN